MENVGSSTVFCEWGPDVDFIGGHYCEPGVNEWNAKDREQTAFYEWGTTKDEKGGSGHDDLRRRQAPGQLEEGQDLRKTWEGAIAGWVTDAIKDGAKPEEFGLSNEDVIQAQGGLLLPDKYGRIFHPTRFAHMMIAENVLRTMDLTKAKLMGKKAATTTLLGCPLPTGPASHPGEQNTCEVDDPSGGYAKFKASDADKVIKEFCLKHQGDTTKSGPDGILERYQNGDDKGSSLILMASLNTEPACQNYPNAGRLNYFDCSSNFVSAMNNCEYLLFSSSLRPFPLFIQCTALSLSLSCSIMNIDSLSPSSDLFIHRRHQHRRRKAGRPQNRRLRLGCQRDRRRRGHIRRAV